jgi:small-conductance mechanosensitive channel
MADIVTRFNEFQNALASSNPWLWWLGALALALALAFGLRRLLFAAVARGARRTTRFASEAQIQRLRAPVGLILPLFALTLIAPLMPAGADTVALVHRGVNLALIAAFGWLAARLVGIAAEAISLRHQIDVADNLQARAIRTRIEVLSRIVVLAVIVVTVALMLISVPSVRNVGVSLFASAGVVGLVAGMAARPALSNLIAGLQIALTQPIRLDDVVIVESEWGRVEDIGSTYVVVRIWDLRRLVVPLSYFIETPFQNWTRDTANLLGTVMIYVDYTVPVDAVRAELHRILQSTKLWDGKVWNLQVSDATGSVVELRALMSAPNSSQAWDLRCHVRERLIAFLQERFPDSLPKQRSEVVRSPGQVPADIAAAAAAASPDGASS